MTKYETYSDLGTTNFLINVYYKEDGDCEYKVVSYCCDEANDFVRHVKKLKKVVNIMEEELEYGVDDYAEDYLKDVWDAYRNYKHPLNFGWKCSCSNELKLSVSYKYEIVEDELVLSNLVKGWLKMFPKEDILLDSGYCTDL